MRESGVINLAEESLGQELSEVAGQGGVGRRVDFKAGAEAEYFAQGGAEFNAAATEIDLCLGEGGGEGFLSGVGYAVGVAEPALKETRGVFGELVERSVGGDERAELAQAAQLFVQEGQLMAQIEFEQTAEAKAGLPGGFLGAAGEAQGDAVHANFQRGESVDRKSVLNTDLDRAGQMLLEGPGHLVGFFPLLAGAGPGGGSVLRDFGTGGAEVLGEQARELVEVAGGEEFAAFLINHAYADSEVFGQRF